MPTQTGPTDSPDQMMDTITTAILARHPDLNPQQVRVEVLATYTRLARTSRVTEHLPVLVQHQVTDRLRQTAATPGGRQPLPAG